MKPLAANPLPTLADEIVRALREDGVTLSGLSEQLGADLARVRSAARTLNGDGRAVLMRRISTREFFLVPSHMVTRQGVPDGLRCCVCCGKPFEIARWKCPAKRGKKLAYSPRKTCSQKCAGLIAVHPRERRISQEQKDLCISLRLEHNLSAPEIANRVGICNHSAYRILKSYPDYRPPKRKPIRGSEWTPEHDDILRELYPFATDSEIQAALPTHSWMGIQRRACFLKVRRRRAGAIRSAEHRLHPLILQLLHFREQSGIARSVLAQRAGILQGMILGWESGKTKPDFLSFCKWASALGFEISLTPKQGAQNPLVLRRAA